MFLLVILLALQAAQPIALKRFEVVRVDPAAMERIPPSLRAIFADPNPGAEPVAGQDEVTAQAGFTPKLPASPNKPEFGIMDSVNGDVTIKVSELNTALESAKASDVSIPKEWD